MNQPEFNWQDGIKNARITIENDAGIWVFDLNKIDDLHASDLKDILFKSVVLRKEVDPLFYSKPDPKRKDQIIAGIGVK